MMFIYLDIMKKVLEEKIKSTEHEILWQQSELQRLNDKLNKMKEVKV